VCHQKKLLRSMVSHRGINPNPEKVTTTTKMKPHKSIHDVHELMGCMVVVSKFIS
jgi:hypothetical protein